MFWWTVNKLRWSDPASLPDTIVIWDDNQISIEDDTSVAFTEDPVARYAAYGWHTQTVDWRGADGPYEEDVPALHAAIENAKATTDRPSFIRLRTIIGWPAPTKQNTGGIHGAKLGADEVAATKRILGVDPETQFHVDDEVREHSLAVVGRGAKIRQEWDANFAAWQSANPDRAALLEHGPTPLHRKSFAPVAQSNLFETNEFLS